ncbi:MAG TPA: prepilin-type N-terminal cleavage/methylation domain-containing protein [Polyangiaceae bacterium]|nr:prepilin-type N-terminal cleavage/methylation domain-containing protein [Polyangiaceae bacterium]
MPSARPARAFTLIEVMIVVVIVGVLALVATVAYRKWILSSYVGEAQEMLGNIRVSEEAFRAENTGYLNVSASLTDLYPTTAPNGNSKTAWGASPGQWAALNVNPSAPVRFGYAVIADNTPPDAPPATVTNNGVAVDLTPMLGKPWFVATAVCDIDNNSTTPSTTLYAVSGTNTIFVNNEGQ